MMKVLVVDDSGIMRKVITKELLNLHFLQENIVEATDGQEAVKAASEDTFGLILMDWNMPNMLGIDAVVEIRAKGITTPILMVTTEGEKTNVIRAIQAGANNYLVKPFTSESLQEKIVGLLPELPKPPEEAPKEKRIGVDVETGKVITE